MTTIVSLTLLLFLYIKHCNGGITDDKGGNSAPWTVVSFARRKKSVIDLSVVESLLIFIFGALWRQKEGLDCIVNVVSYNQRSIFSLGTKIVNFKK